VNKAYYGVQINDINSVLRKRVHLEMEAGDTVFFHPLLIHASGANLTNMNRRSITVHFANSTLCEYIRLDEKKEQKIMEELGATKLGKMGLQYHSIWATKSRQVCGDEGNLKFGKSAPPT